MSIGGRITLVINNTGSGRTDICAAFGVAGGESRELSLRMFICGLWIWWRQSNVRADGERLGDGE